MTLLRSAAFGVALLTASSAWSAPCSGFLDVDSASPFCPNVEWLKNRSITQGCSSTSVYCPADPVSRLAMAAFMNRLGTALTQQKLTVDSAPGAIDLDSSVVACQTTDFAVTGYPRQAYVDLAFAGTAPADVDVAADLVATFDSGGTWANINAVGSRGLIPANQWGAIGNLATLDLAVGDVVRFGVRLGRGSGSVDLSDSRCNLRVVVTNRNGASSPF